MTEGFLAEPTAHSEGQAGLGDSCTRIPDGVNHSPGKHTAVSWRAPLGLRARRVCARFPRGFPRHSYEHMAATSDD